MSIWLYRANLLITTVSALLGYYLMVGVLWPFYYIVQSLEGIETAKLLGAFRESYLIRLIGSPVCQVTAAIVIIAGLSISIYGLRKTQSSRRLWVRCIVLNTCALVWVPISMLGRPALLDLIR